MRDFAEVSGNSGGFWQILEDPAEPCRKLRNVSGISGFAGFRRGFGWISPDSRDLEEVWQDLAGLAGFRRGLRNTARDEAEICRGFGGFWGIPGDSGGSGGTLQNSGKCFRNFEIRGI